MIGFSVPQDGEVLVISYEGVHLLHLGAEVTVETDGEFAEYNIYEPDSGIARYRGREYLILGLHGGNPILKNPDGAQLVLDTESATLSIVLNGATVFSTSYENFSGDWVAATFSPDGRYIVLGCPYDFDLIVLRHEIAA